MARKKTSFLARELVYLLLAPLIVFVLILAYGVLFDHWYKEPMMILIFTGYTYGGLLILRFLIFLFRKID